MIPTRLVRRILTIAMATVALTFFITPVDAAKKKKAKRPKSTAWDKQDFPPKDKICFTLYTLHNKILKMNVQLYPLAAGESRDVELAIEKGGAWHKVASSKVRENDYTSPAGAKAWNSLLRVENWDDSKDWKYRVTALGGVATYDGIVRKNPVDKDEIVVAAFTGNSNKDRSPRTDMIRNIKAQNPDLLFFSGDQSYDHKNHLGAWLLFGRQFGELTRNYPSVCLPDDHDVGHGNLWGEGGKKSTARGCSDGGYAMPVPYVKEVEFAQTCHLPDPYDPTPIQRGIGVYYTRLNIGGIDFAIIEDRKWKSGPMGKIPQQGPRPDHIRNPNYDPKSVDLPGLKLLGDRQLKFLREWGKDWKGATMKCVLSQTIFANAAHLHGGPTNRLHADMDSNGWPQTGRRKALTEIRKAYALMIAGDQHLATVIHHGVDNWEDSGWSFCVPSIINFYNRWWHPLEKPEKRIETPLEFTGRYYDGFHNKLAMYAYANPGDTPSLAKISRYNGRAAGHGIIRFNKKTRKITMECWPRGVDLTKPNQPQYPGWPITIHQYDNYSRAAVAWLPDIKVEGMNDPVVQVINEADGKVVYTLRIQGSTFAPKVFATGTYTLRIGEPGKMKEFKGLKATASKSTSSMKVSL